MQSSKGDQIETIRGTGSTEVSRTIQLRADQRRGATVVFTPSTPGRFQVLVDGTPQRLGYLDDKGRPAYDPDLFGPETRGTWYDFFPDSGVAIFGPPPIYGPEPGATARITIRAVDTTGPWTAKLYWSKK
ncbi:hypothetical protein [Flexivirga caeni]|uniref:Uncharacterized protein n=1 Tax=Flexivirga caeni TaxID=2294115 RepID=A0A3M9M8Z0_9MICO|nr:hypothetical protein [Flexivirga caeni]RNI21343.1 hypothetical protein EFY87_11715 [Flexivirga caeni]